MPKTQHELKTKNLKVASNLREARGGKYQKMQNLHIQL
jgi:hypothetical protein